MKQLVKNRYAQGGAVAAVAAVFSVLAAGVSGAATYTTPITSGFATAQTNLTTYMGLAVALVIALVLIGAGLRFLVKWIRKAVSAS